MPDLRINHTTTANRWWFENLTEGAFLRDWFIKLRLWEQNVAQWKPIES